MNAHRPPVLPLLPLTALFALTSAGPGLAVEDSVASLQAQGYTVLANTEVEVGDDEAVLFEGCEVGKEVLLTNRQSFVCEEEYLIEPEFAPDAVILRHPTTGATRLLVEGHAYVGSLKGTASAPVAVPGPAPVPAAASAPVAATVPSPAPTPAPMPMPTTPLPAATPAPAPVAGAPTPVPGPRPLPPGFGGQGTTMADPGTAAPPPSTVRLIAPVAGSWATSANLGGARVEGLAMLNPDGTFNRFERWDFGLTVQVWGTYTATPITPTRFQLTQRPSGWDPKEWCVMGQVCQPLHYPVSAAQFTFIDANRVRDDQTQVVYERQAP